MQKGHYFFVGVAGVGMSALAQYLTMDPMGRFSASGSDRQFASSEKNPLQEKLESAGVTCCPQDGSGVHSGVHFLVVSTAIEKGNPDVDKAVELGIPILHRADLLAQIIVSRPSIAVSGTSGKSSVTGMIYHILRKNGCRPSLITGAGLVDLEAQGLIGNAIHDSGEWLVVEADESDGSLVKHHPKLGLILNVDKDHKELSELEEIFKVFQGNCEKLAVNLEQPRSAAFSKDSDLDFSVEKPSPIRGAEYKQRFATSYFTINGVPFQVPVPGYHSMLNSLAASTAACFTGLTLEQCSEALRDYPGIHRRHQILLEKNGVVLVDDFAHNPAKIAASIESAQAMGRRVRAWFQPHGFQPTRFLRNDFVQEIASVLRPRDEIWMSEIYYAGGTVTRDISAADLIGDLKERSCRAFFEESREKLFETLISELQSGDVLLMMGARDPSLGAFAQSVRKRIEASFLG
jgi:UDP-N-acetylmuramate--alanine ligase